jgi:phosphomannomutase
MNTPKLTVSGYRGIWGETLDEDIARDLSLAFAKFLIAHNGKKILIGYDARESGKDLVNIVTQTIISLGVDVTIGGLLPTPSVLFLVRELGFDGAVIVTASHNPKEYNGLKFVTREGMFTNEDEVLEIEKNRHKTQETRDETENERLKTKNNGFGIKDERSKTKYIPLGEIRKDETLGEKHIEHILKNIDVELIKNRKFKVVLDPINSAGSILTPKLLESLGCEVIVINGNPNGDFAHMPEPLPENLKSLGEKVLEVGADIGFAQDPDADRLVVCDEKGKVVFEEYTLSLSIKSVLEKLGSNNPLDIAINVSTSSTNEELIRKSGGKAYRTKVGEANVVSKMLEKNIIIGGEGGGGVIYTPINACRDSLMGIALILEMLARGEEKISEIVESLPKFEMQKNKFKFEGDLKNLYEKMMNKFGDGIPNKIDGLRLDFPDGSWIHLRPSNTEPIVRLIGEAKNKEKIDKLIEKVKNLINS